MYIWGISNGEPTMATIMNAMRTIAEREGSYRPGMSPDEIVKAVMVIQPDFIAIRRRIFLMFCARDGISAIYANEEFDRLQSVRGDLSKYLRVQRTGSRFPLTRQQKESLALTFDNAGNHASFEFGRD